MPRVEGEAEYTPTLGVLIVRARHLASDRRRVGQFGRQVEHRYPDLMLFGPCVPRDNDSGALVTEDERRRTTKSPMRLCSK